MTGTTTVALTGKSGRRYEFTVFPYDTKFASVAAVYAVTRLYQSSDGSFKYRILYIGQTDNLAERFGNHHKESCFKRNNASHIAVHRDNDEASRLRKEADLIAVYSPVCNG